MCDQGHNHPSVIESQYCNTLHMIKRTGEIKEIIYEKVFELRIEGKLIAKHKPDFYITRKDGNVEVHEVKGFETDIWRIKRRMFEALYPEIPYIVVK